ncbi:MAG: hypothetical protein GEV03_08260 [Streptosporangiales bacterium]|nr:hypothetical protein [Streptosporangiales bacterium]
MAVVALVLGTCLGVLLFLLLGAQVEMFRGLEQVREQAGLIDRVTPVDLGKVRGLAPSEVGLPATLDTEISAVVLFLSDKCVVCRSIAASLDGTIPRGLWLVLEPGTAPRDAELSQELGFDPDDVIIDWGREITHRIGIEATPLGVVVENGRLSRAATIPSSRQLYEFLGAARPITRQQPKLLVKSKGA